MLSVYISGRSIVINVTTNARINVCFKISNSTKVYVCTLHSTYFCRQGGEEPGPGSMFGARGDGEPEGVIKKARKYFYHIVFFFAISLKSYTKLHANILNSKKTDPLLPNPNDPRPNLLF